LNTEEYYHLLNKFSKYQQINYIIAIHYTPAEFAKKVQNTILFGSKMSQKYRLDHKFRGLGFGACIFGIFDGNKYMTKMENFAGSKKFPRK
jgi:hypothetical protein